MGGHNANRVSRKAVQLSNQGVRGFRQSTSATPVGMGPQGTPLPVLNEISEANGVVLASPNRGEDSLTSASGRMQKNEQKAFRVAADKIDKILGLKGATNDALGAWKDGAENSTMTEYKNASPEKLLVAAAMRGLLGEQKATIHFKPHKNGKGAIHEFIVGGTPEQLNQDLIALNVPYHTIVPIGNGNNKIVVFEENRQANTVQKLAMTAKKLNGGTVTTTVGNGAFLGSWGTRFAGRKEYENVLRPYLQKHPQIAGKWAKLLNSWKFGINNERPKNPPPPKDSRLPFPEAIEEAYTASSNPQGGQQKVQDAIFVGDRKVQSKYSGTISGKTFHEVHNGKQFHAAINSALETEKEDEIKKGTYKTIHSEVRDGFVNALSPEEYNDMTQLMLDDAKAGLAISKTGEIRSVFKGNNSKYKNALDTLMTAAINRGGDHLDCFGHEDLVAQYFKYGFIPVAKIKFNPRLAPPGWNYARDGQPDLVFMVHDGRRQEEIVEYIDKFNNAPLKERQAMMQEMRDRIQQLLNDLPYTQSYQDAHDRTEKIAQNRKQKRTERQGSGIRTNI